MGLSPKRVAGRIARQVPLDLKAIKACVEHQLVPEILGWLERHPRPEEPIGDVSPGRIATGSFPVPSFLDGRQIDLTASVKVGAEPARAAKVPALSAAARVSTQDIYVLLNGAFTPEQLLKEKYQGSLSACHHETCMPYGLYSLLIHEATHISEALQERKVKYNIKDVDNGRDPSKYINDPSEVRAFLQQIVQEAIKGIGHTKGRGWPLRRQVDFALQMSTTWKLIEKHLSSSNRGKILKAVYQELDRQGLLEDS